jgi:hypothetical protein
MTDRKLTLTIEAKAGEYILYVEYRDPHSNGRASFTRAIGNAEMASLLSGLSVLGECFADRIRAGIEEDGEVPS